ncbi:MAG: YbhB/YbcL family Raf kinase inhibitor-like protein [Chloroflexota bacterium]
MKKLLLILVALVLLLLAGAVILFLLLAPARTETFSSETEFTMNLTSPAFTQGQPIPSKFSCKGADVSPALAWDEPPAATLSFALIMDDPDAPMGTWVHWVFFNIPGGLRSLQEAVPTTPTLPDGSVQGITSARSVGYHGPCPPSGTHRYFFKLYALDIKLDLASKADKQAVLNTMQGHILAQSELMGTFSK